MSWLIKTINDDMKLAMDAEGLKKLLRDTWGISAAGAAGGMLALLFSLGIPQQQLAQQLQQGVSPQEIMRSAPQNAGPEAVLPSEMLENQEFSQIEVDNVVPRGTLKQEPRGIRNNNPGNLVQNETQWDGAIEGGDTRFVTFESPEYGVRAMARVLRNYQRKHGLRTIAEIIGRWSPQGENNTQAYIDHVSSRLGISPDSPINLGDDELLARFISLIVQHENGENPYDDEIIRRGISLEKRSAKEEARVWSVKMGSMAR